MAFFYQFWKKARVYYTLSISSGGGGAQAPPPPLDSPLSKHISFVHVNISSAPKNLRNFELFLSNLKHNFSIISCSETWFKISTKDRFTPKGYEHIYDYRLKKRGGGTSIFVKNSIIFEARHALKLDINVDLVN